MMFSLELIYLDVNLSLVMQTLGEDYEKYTLAKSYFDVKEYDRAAYFIQDCSHPKVYFLYMYSRYLADEKRKTDNRPDSIGKHCADDVTSCW